MATTTVRLDRGRGAAAFFSGTGFTRATGARRWERGLTRREVYTDSAAECTSSQGDPLLRRFVRLEGTLMRTTCVLVVALIAGGCTATVDKQSVKATQNAPESTQVD